MVASSRVIVVTNSRGGAFGSSITGIDEKILATHVSLTSSIESPSSIIRSKSHSKATSIARMEPRLERFNTSQRKTRTEIRKTLPPRNTDRKNLQRTRSDSIALSESEDSKERRSIFGNYFKERSRSCPAPHAEDEPPPSPLPSLQRLSLQSPRPTLKRRSFSATHPSSFVHPSSKTTSDNLNGNTSTSHRHQIHDHPSEHDHPIDYRVFAPSQEQVAESTICSRYQALNRDHQKSYESLLERQVQVDRSLPPFPSPLIRFCSETTATAAASDSFSSPKHNCHRRGSSNYFPSSDGEMHYHGVYSLLSPVSILRPSRYGRNKISATTTNKVSNEFTSTFSIEPNNDIPAPYERSHLCPPISSSFNFPRSYIENSSILNNFRKNGSGIGLDEDEEMKESDIVFTAPSSTKDIIMIANDVIHEDSSLTTNTASFSSENTDEKDSCENDSEEIPPNSQGLHHQSRRLRFDPRVTVTEFEDPVRRKWYHDSELDLHKKEAIALATSYLKEHPVIAEWYRRAVLDPVTKTYRKRALFSLPVFSSTYADSRSGEPHDRSSIMSSPFQKNEQNFPSVRKILVVHPNSKIASLFCKSMSSMFTSAELVSTGSSEEASRLIKESFAKSFTGSTVFDIIIIEQHLSLNKKKPNGILKDLDRCSMGFLDMFLRKKNGDDSIIVPPASSEIRSGSDLIHQVCELSLQKQQQCCSAMSSCLVIGVSIRPKRDAMILRRAGADIVWGIPIPTVGDNLRNKLFTKLLAKRSSMSKG